MTPFNIRTQKVCEDPYSDEALLPAKAWLKNCIYSHTQCSRTTGQRLPCRILEINAGDIYLRSNVTAAGQAEYACLSHCWGKLGPNVRLTSATEDLLIDGIPLKRLPKTFLDAAEVCIKLDIHYLWIDALCRLQSCTQMLEKLTPYQVSTRTAQLTGNKPRQPWPTSTKVL